MKRCTFRTATPVIFSILFIAACSKSDYQESSWTPSPDEPRAFVTTLGTDTVTVERYSRTGSQIEGELVERTPYTHVVRYTAGLNKDGLITSLEAEMTTPETNAEGQVAASWSVSIGEDQTMVTRTGGQNPGSVTLDTGLGVIPTLGRASSAMYVFEQTAHQLLNADGATDGILLLGPTSSAARANAAQVVAPDTVAMDFFGAPRLGWLDDRGQLLGVSGAGTTMKSETRRVPATFDPAALASRWAAMDANGTGIGTPSPGATVSATVSGAHIEIVYSRPARRGREIWGGLVPYGRIWRTGANAATQFSTDRNLDFAGTVIPAGTYTLWTTFEPDTQTMIFNSQTGQWGTEYDMQRDLARFAMDRTVLESPSERFTISVTETDHGGILNLDWDQTRLSLPFSIQ